MKKSTTKYWRALIFILAGLAGVAQAENTLLINENFETTAQTTYDPGNSVASALVVDPDNSPETSGEQDIIEGADPYAYWNIFPSRSVDMNTVGLEWSFSVTANNPLVSLFFDYGTDEANDKGVVYRILDADNADAVVTSTTGQTTCVSASFTSFKTTFELGAGNYKLQLVSDEYENYRGCMVDNVQLVAHPAHTAVSTWDAARDYKRPDAGGTNPNGEWSYIALDVYFEHPTNMVDKGWGWGLGDGNIWINNQSGTRYGIAPGQLSVEPGRDASNGYTPIPSAARWTAPAFEGTGTVHVVGQFFEGDSGTVSTTVRHGTNSLWTGTVGTFDETVQVVTGDTIDFATYGQWDYGNTPLDTQVILTYDVISTNTLIVSSEHGTPIPAVGTNNLIGGTSVSCSVSGETIAQTNYVPVGWTGTGSVPTSGTSNTITVTMATDSSITWNWQTNYWLEVSVSGNGSVDVPDGFYAKGSEQILSATPDTGWLFMGWSGAATGTNEAFVMMAEPQAIMATFSDDADGDGLINSNEWAIGSDPWKSDTDGDGFDDKTEVDYGLSPTQDSSGLVDYIADNGSTFGLYSSNAVLDVAVGQILLETAGGNASLNLQLEQSDDLQTWTNVGNVVEWTLPVGSEKQYFRVRSGK